MPHISVHTAKQPDLEKKKKLIEKLTDAMVEAYGVPREAVAIEIWENDPVNVAHGGVLLADRMGK